MTDLPVHRRARAAVRPLWETTFRDPVREGRLRLVGLSRVERQLARAGLVLLALLLVSTLGAELWRHGSLTATIGGGGQLVFVPDGVLAVTVLSLGLAWLLILRGAMDASPLVRLVVAAVFLLVNATFGLSTAFAITGHSWVLRHGATLVTTGYYVVPGALVASALVARWPRASRWLEPALRVVAALGVAAVFAGLLWLHVALVRQGAANLMPIAIATAVTQVAATLLPLVYVSLVAVIDFAFDVSESVMTPVSTLAVGSLKLVVLALVAVKVWFEVGARRDFWSVHLLAQPQAVVRTAGSVLLLVAVVVVVTRFRTSDDTEVAKEGVTIAAAAVLAAPYLFQTAYAAFGLLWFTWTGSSAVTDTVEGLPIAWANSWGFTIAGGVAALAGVWLMRRSDGGLGDELGSGMIVVGGWNALTGVLANSGLQLGYSPDSVDVTVTLLVLVVLVAGWRRLTAGTALVLATVVVFSWLLTSQGDYISYVGALLRLPASLVLVFGIVWLVTSGSAFASKSSRRLPTDARALLFVGYLLLSVTILDWQQAAHASSSTEDQQAAYFFIALPLAGWLVGRRLLRRPGGR